MTDVRIITEALGGSPLSLALQRGTAPAAWTAGRPGDLAAWQARIGSRRNSAPWGTHWKVLEAAVSASGAAGARLERVRAGNGVVVTTGQQPGLFGGPIYTWSKALGALALADQIERDTGVPCAPVFWAATDDADFLEASITVVARAGGVEVLRSPHAPPAGTPMAHASLGDLSEQLARFDAASGSVADGRALDSLRQAYGNPGATVGSAYLTLLRSLLEPLGIAVLDASHDSVRRLSDPLLRRALECAPAVERALQQRRSDIEGQGFALQVDDLKGLSLVFERQGAGKRRLSLSDARAALEKADCILTPNVVLRPVVEAAILPTVAYLGGPAEVAYFAQVGAVAESLGAEQPLVLPRWSCTLIEPHVAALLAQFGVNHDALARPDALETSVARLAMGADSSEALRELRAAIDRAAERLAPDAERMRIDAALVGGRQTIHHRVDRLERRFVAAVKRREHERMRDVATLRAALYPMGKRQERTLNLLPMLARHGLVLLDEMRDAAASHARGLIAG